MNDIFLKLKIKFYKNGYITIEELIKEYKYRAYDYNTDKEINLLDDKWYIPYIINKNYDDIIDLKFINEYGDSIIVIYDLLYQVITDVFYRFKNHEFKILAYSNYKNGNIKVINLVHKNIFFDKYIPNKITGIYLSQNHINKIDCIYDMFFNNNLVPSQIEYENKIIKKVYNINYNNYTDIIKTVYYNNDNNIILKMNYKINKSADLSYDFIQIKYDYNGEPLILLSTTKILSIRKISTLKKKLTSLSNENHEYIFKIFLNALKLKINKNISEDEFNDFMNYFNSAMILLKLSN